MLARKLAGEQGSEGQEEEEDMACQWEQLQPGARVWKTKAM